MANALGPSSNGIYVYCGTSTVFSNMKPDPSIPGGASKFDPTNPRNPFTAGIRCADSDNDNLGYYYYAPDPTGRLPYLQISGVGDNDDLGLIPGQSPCTLPFRPYGFSWVVPSASPSPGPKIITLCLDNNMGAAYTSSNANYQYWKTPDAVGATLGAHLGSLSHQIIHEMAHCLGTGQYFWNVPGGSFD